MNLFKKTNSLVEKESEEIADNIVNSAQKQDKLKKKFKLGGDTYAMAFSALHWDSSRQMNLSQNEVYNAYHSSCIVSFIQLLMLTVVAFVIFGDGPLVISMPSSVTILALRFVCTMLMHLQVESDVRQGLRMMKYLVNHTEDFSAPFNAFAIGFMQVFTGLATELACICFLATVGSEIDVIIKYMALSSIAKVDDIYANALPADNRIKNDYEQLEVKNHRRDLNNRIEKEGLGIAFRIGRFVYKVIRMFYSSYVFYFFPYTTLIVPYIAEFLKRE